MDGKETMCCPFCGGEMNVVNDGILTRMPPIKIYTAVCGGCSARIEVRDNDGESKLRNLDSRLMPDGMEWPRWGDGKKVRIGDEFKASDFVATAIVSSVEVGNDVYVRCMRATRLLDECTHIVPDTQERIDADALKEHLDYWGDCEHYAFSCDSCPHSITETGITCRANMILDLLRRQRELDKREAEK